MCAKCSNPILSQRRAQVLDLEHHLIISPISINVTEISSNLNR